MEEKSAVCKNRQAEEGGRHTQKRNFFWGGTVSCEYSEPKKIRQVAASCEYSEPKNINGKRLPRLIEDL